jgi:hypothetical protein
MFILRRASGVCHQLPPKQESLEVSLLPDHSTLDNSGPRKIMEFLSGDWHLKIGISLEK